MVLLDCLRFTYPGLVTPDGITLMATKYPKVVPVRLTPDDLERSKQVVKLLDRPRSYLMRKAWREFLDAHLGTPDENASK